jgi:16S rRNA (guanine527-N7)-methyltransferase
MHPGTTIDTSRVAKCLKDAGFEPSERQVELLALHTQAVLERNQTLNLTRITEVDAVIRLHILDSVTILPFLAAAPSGDIVDLGAGAGFPGVPLAILQDRPVTLVESVKKKAAFLAEVCEELAIPARIVGLRAEELATREREAYAAVVARALASLPALVELAAPLLKKRGVLIAMKGSPSVEELESGDAAARMCGLKRGNLVRLKLSGGDEERTIVVYESVGRPRLKLPRRPGMAQRHPLA